MHSDGSPTASKIQISPIAIETNDITGSYRGEIGCTNSIYEQPWWLDAVAPGQWREAVVYRGGQVAARLPYVLRRRYGMVCLGHPPLTQTLGPWLRKSEGKYSTRLSEEKELIGELIAQLPPFDLFAQNCSMTIRNVLPFHWHGYSTTVHYTYRIEELQDLETVWGGFTKECRNVIRKAEKKLIVREELDTSRIYESIERMWFRQGTPPPFTREVFLRLDDACRIRSARRALCAEDSEGNLHSFVYLVWDKRATYYLLGCGDPRFRESGAQSLLIWEAMKFAAGVSATFDFEGSMNERIEHFFRSFGAKQTILLHISKVSRTMAALSAVKDLVQFAVRKKVRWFY